LLTEHGVCDNLLTMVNMSVCSRAAAVRLEAGVKKPDVNVFNYTDYQKFISDWFDAAKLENSWLSHRSFVRAAGYRSSSDISNVIRGERHLSIASAERFARVMELSRAELDYFKLLIRYARAESQTERAECLVEINGNKSFREAHVHDVSQHMYWAVWYCPAIYELAQQPSFRSDPAWIAETLCPKITQTQAKEALETLVTLGMLERDAGGGLQPAKRGVQTASPGKPMMSMYFYHHQMIKLAQDALNTVPETERVYYGSTMTVSSETHAEVQRLLREAVTRSLGHCEEASAGRDGRVYQLNVQFFPISEQPVPVSE
jgi:uncharacterized protein (TIGR02147 family)